MYLPAGRMLSRAEWPGGTREKDAQQLPMNCSSFPALALHNVIHGYLANR